MMTLSIAFSVYSVIFPLIFCVFMFLKSFVTGVTHILKFAPLADMALYHYFHVHTAEHVKCNFRGRVDFF